MLDLSLPLELENGTPCTFKGPYAFSRTGAFLAEVRGITKGDSSATPHTYWFEPDGTLGGSNGDSSYWRIRNAGPTIKEEYEEWFVA